MGLNTALLAYNGILSQNIFKLDLIYLQYKIELNTYLFDI